jgi:hypothetical protein
MLGDMNRQNSTGMYIPPLNGNMMQPQHLPADQFAQPISYPGQTFADLPTAPIMNFLPVVMQPKDLLLLSEVKIPHNPSTMCRPEETRGRESCDSELGALQKQIMLQLSGILSTSARRKREEDHRLFLRKILNLLSSCNIGQWDPFLWQCNQTAAASLEQEMGKKRSWRERPSVKLSDYMHDQKQLGSMPPGWEQQSRVAGGFVAWGRGLFNGNTHAAKAATQNRISAGQQNPLPPGRTSISSAAWQPTPQKSSRKRSAGEMGDLKAPLEDRIHKQPRSIGPEMNPLPRSISSGSQPSYSPHQQAVGAQGIQFQTQAPNLRPLQHHPSFNIPKEAGVHEPSHSAVDTSLITPTNNAFQDTGVDSDLLDGFMVSLNYDASFEQASGTYNNHPVEARDLNQDQGTSEGLILQSVEREESGFENQVANHRDNFT